jgi:hypothetical protein
MKIKIKIEDLIIGFIIIGLPILTVLYYDFVDPIK